MPSSASTPPAIYPLSLHDALPISFSAARTAATVALRASGYRTSTQLGHHIKTIESLELTIKADSKMIQKMKTFSKKRNVTSYDSARSEEHTSELQSRVDLVCRLLLLRPLLSTPFPYTTLFRSRLVLPARPPLLPCERRAIARQLNSATT